MGTSTKAWIYWLSGIGVYLTGAVITATLLYNHGVEFPILRSLLWPIPLVKLLLGRF